MMLQLVTLKSIGESISRTLVVVHPLRRVAQGGLHWGSHDWLCAGNAPEEDCNRSMEVQEHVVVGAHGDVKDK